MLSFYTSLIGSESDRSRFEQIYLAYRQDMYRAAFAVLKNPEDAEDAVHDAFLRLIDNLGKVDGVCPKTRSYLLVITRNTAIDRYNRRKRFVPVEDAEELPDAESTEEAALEQFDKAALKAAVMQLPQIYYDVICLEQVCDMDAHEIAAQLGLTYEAARKRLQRAKKLLKQIIEAGDGK